jgi:hypothetical protein
MNTVLKDNYFIRDVKLGKLFQYVAEQIEGYKYYPEDADRYERLIFDFKNTSAKVWNEHGHVYGKLFGTGDYQECIEYTLDMTVGNFLATVRKLREDLIHYKENKLLKDIEKDFND